MSRHPSPRPRAHHTPRQPFDRLAAGRRMAGKLSRLSGGLSDGEQAGEGRCLDLKLCIWRLVDAAVGGQLTLDDTNDMAMIGNIATLVAHEAGDELTESHARAWNITVRDIRQRYAQLGKVGVNAAEYHCLRHAAQHLDGWIHAQPRARIQRAHMAVLNLGPLAPYGQEI